jgi:tRNA (cytidine/uridine-2'-O-)-methyltransferase
MRLAFKRTKETMPAEIILFEPEIPPNTGNIMRLCANTGSRLNLIKPLGFDIDEKSLRRAGMDYRELCELNLFDNYESCLEYFKQRRIVPISTKGGASLFKFKFKQDDCLLFGPETRGLPSFILDGFSAEEVVRIPMLEGSRSMNLSNAASVVLYEQLRQFVFCE